MRMLRLMVDNLSLSRIWSKRITFLALALLIIFFHLIPLETLPRRWAPPDLLIAFAFAWVLRRPDYVPALSIAFVMLTADLLFQRPPGLMAVLVVLAAEYLKNRTAGFSEASFAVEWFAVSMVVIAITVLNRLILVILAVQQAQFSLSLIQMLATIAVYPLVVLATQIIMGVRRPAPGDAEAFGGRA